MSGPDKAMLETAGISAMLKLSSALHKRLFRHWQHHVGREFVWPETADLLRLLSEEVFRLERALRRERRVRLRRRT